MELELMNIFHLYDNDKLIIIRCNCTKKQLAEMIKEYANDNIEFRPIKFRAMVTKKGFKFYYEGGV